MKRTKRLTRRQLQNPQLLLAATDLPKKGRRKTKLVKALKKHLASTVDQVTLSPTKVEPIFSLENYFAKKAQKRLEKLTQREEARQAKADKIAVRAKEKAIKKAAREAKEAKRAARLAKEKA